MLYEVITIAIQTRQNRRWWLDIGDGNINDLVNPVDDKAGQALFVLADDNPRGGAQFGSTELQPPVQIENRHDNATQGYDSADKIIV